MIDRCSRGRDNNHNRAKTHCKYGHELTEENVWRNKQGYRWCRKCFDRRRHEGKDRVKS
jgi:hypothetical protein